MKTIEELNEAIRSHKRRNQLTETECAVLDLLAQYSCKEIGRSFLAKSTIAELVGKSRRTIVRVCNRLEQLGIIAQHKRMRQTGDRRQTSNLIVIQSAKRDDVVPNETPVIPEMTRQEAPSRNLNNNTYKETVIPSDALKNSLPTEIYSAMSRYFNAKEIYRYYGVLLRAKASVDPAIILEDHAAEFVNAWHAVVLKLKHGRIRKLDGYLYEAFRKAAFTVKARLNAPESLFDRFRKVFE
ncbi:helix-turn-helix domain-containing protein [Bacillus gobiensis]|uniref:helix-turn-helix domain-containing protein n=1 Tax=Bacillus gobiensis TaxID=1441095 RepID=UPI003D1AEF16